MLMMMISKNVLSKIAKSVLCAFFGLLLLSIILVRQSTMTGFVDVVLKVYIYFFLIYCFCILLLGELINRLGKLKVLLGSNLFLYIIVGLSLFLIVIPMHEYVNDDILLGFSVVATFLITMITYLKVGPSDN